LKNVEFSIRTAKLMQMMPKHIFWSITECSIWYATMTIKGSLQESITIVKAFLAQNLAGSPDL